MFLNLTYDQWQAIGVLATILASIIAIAISVVTLRQNNKMIESTSRPNLSIYGNSTNTGSPMLYFVIHNFGSSLAEITSLKYDFDFTNCYKIQNEKDYIKTLVGCTLAPNQSKICLLDYDKVDKIVNFEISYKSSAKSYNEKFAVDFRAGNAMVAAKTSNKDKELETISYTLQDMLLKDL